MALRLWQYLGGATLWIDELAVAHNLLDHPLAALLTRPLDRGQMAPAGFLVVEKLVQLAFGANDYALRLFPLAAGVASMILFARLARRTTSPWDAIAASTLFATAIPLILQAATIKQYSADVLGSIILLDLGGSLLADDSRRSRMKSCLIALVCLAFSQAAVLTLAGIGTVLTLRSVRRGDFVRWFPMLSVWALGAIASIAHAQLRMTAAGRTYLQAFWAHGFLPTDIGALLRSRWPYSEIASLFIDVMHYPTVKPYALLMLAGFALLARKERWVASLLLAPAAITLVAAMARLYPFADRLIFFLLPAFFVAIGTAIGWIALFAARRSPVAGWAVVVAMLAPAVWPVAAMPPVYRVDDVKPLLRRMTGQVAPRDAIYVYYGAVSAVSYYAPQAGLPPGRTTLGDCHRGDTRAYFRELDAFRGTRVWVVFAHASPFYREHEDMVRYLSAIGVARRAIEVPATLRDPAGGDAEAILYDLTDRERLGRANASTFVIHGPQRVDPRLPCEGPVRRR